MKNMKKICIYYWHLTKFHDLKWDHNQELEYTKRKRNQIIDTVLNKGYYIMLKESEYYVHIFIDNQRFIQR